MSATQTKATLKSPVTDDWETGMYGPGKKDNTGAAYNFKTTPTVSAQGLSITADVQKHIVEAKSGNQLKWVFQTVGRITATPVIHGGNVFIGSRDGYVYSLNASTGKLNWKFLAARDFRKIGASSQMESAWPVTGIKIADNKLAVMAGRHSTLDDGIFFWGLNPSSGNIEWNFRIFQPPTKVEKGGDLIFQPKQEAKILPHSFLDGNSLATSKDPALARGNVGWDGRRSTEFSLNPKAWNGRVIDPETLGDAAPVFIEPMVSERLGNGSHAIFT